MRIWSRQNQPGDQPTVTSRRGAITDEAFDDLARTAGSCTSRRGALKVLLLGVAGAAVGRGIADAAVGRGALAPSASGQPGLSTSTVRRWAMQAVPGQLLTAKTAGCTSRQLHACQAAGGRVFTTAAMKCLRHCKVRKSWGCKQCLTDAANTAVSSLVACLGKCASVHGSGKSGTILLSSQSGENHYLTRADDPVSCSSSTVTSCVHTAELAAAACAATGAVDCLATTAGYAVCLAGEWASCSESFIISYETCDTCPSGTYCTPVDICCSSSLIGCPCAAGGCCVDPLTDSNNCGSCGNKCAPDDTCEAGTCKGCGVSCPAGETCCHYSNAPSLCVDLSTDPNNCGSCGNQCPSGDSCCTANGVSTCVDLDSDLNNCGSCGNQCPSGETCVAGNCSGCGTSLNSCPSGQTCCNGQCVNTGTDSQNCGSCGHACAAGDSCVAGTCLSCLGVSCPAGTTCCNGQCVNTQTDPNNCGNCGNKCAAGETCCNGQCVNTQTDPNNCGNCGVKCAVGASCAAGTCVGNCGPNVYCDPTQGLTCCGPDTASPTCCASGYPCLICEGVATCPGPGGACCGAGIYDPAAGDICCPGTFMVCPAGIPYCCPNGCGFDPSCP